MSSDLTSFFNSLFISDYCAVAALTVIGYEYFLHLPREVELFWKKGVTGASVLFLSNRYLSLLSQALQNSPAPTADKSCSIWQNAGWAITLLPYFPWAVFSGLRSYALCEEHFRLLLAGLVFLLSSVPFGINLVGYRWFGHVVDPIFGCLHTSSASAELQTNFVIVSRCCLIAADFIVVGITWRAAYRTTRLAQIAADRESKNTFSGTLLRDGTIYFLILAIMNMLHLLFTMLSISLGILEDSSNITIFTEPVTSILVSRFILDLQEVNQYRGHSQLSTLSSSQGSIMFERVVGSLGSSLPPLGPDTSLDNDDSLKSYNDHYHDAHGQEVASLGVVQA